jgi:hypothetical protein
LTSKLPSITICKCETNWFPRSSNKADLRTTCRGCVLWCLEKDRQQSQNCHLPQATNSVGHVKPLTQMGNLKLVMEEGPLLDNAIICYSPVIVCLDTISSICFRSWYLVRALAQYPTSNSDNTAHSRQF